MYPDAPAQPAVFKRVLANTFAANISASFLWFALTLWTYLQTKNVMVTAFLGGGYLLLTAVMAVPFGGLVDRWPKKRVMLTAQVITASAFAIGLALFLIIPTATFADLTHPAFWVLVGILLVGAVVESARGITLATTVTLLVPPEGRDRANGFLGLMNGMSFAATSVLAGLAVGQLGMTASFVIAAVVSVGLAVHLALIRINEPQIVHADGVPKPVDFAAAIRGVKEVPSLGWMILFATFNDLFGGVFLALIDPYGLSLVPVEAWGLIWGLVSFGFIIGGAWVARFGLGRRPLRAMLLTDLLMWTVGLTFTIRANIVLCVVGMLIWISVMPISEAAEHTVLQRVVPYAKQGRVFGFIAAVEAAASPLSAFLVGTLAQLLLVPAFDSEGVRELWGWLLGDGPGRGLAATFVLASAVGLAVTIAALASRPYRRIQRLYETSVPVEVVDAHPRVSLGLGAPRAGRVE